MLKLLFKFPKYSPKTTKAKDDIAKLMSIALQRGEIPIVALLAQVNGIKPTLKDLLHPEYPINDVSHWEELMVLLPLEGFKCIVATPEIDIVKVDLLEYYGAFVLPTSEHPRPALDLLRRGSRS